MEMAVNPAVYRAFETGQFP